MFVKTKRTVNKVFLHCSANSSPSWGIDDLRKSHISRGFTDVGYHYFIDFTGKIFNGRSIEKIPAAQEGHNTNTIAICLHGGFNNINDFTEQQLDSLKALCCNIDLAYDKKLTFHGHCEVDTKGKLCPVFDYKKVLNLDLNGFVKY